MESVNQLPRVTDTASSKCVQLKNGSEVTILQIPKLRLWVITDRSNFGPNWIEVDVHNRIYTTRFLMGNDEDLYSALARRFAQYVSEKRDNSQPNSLPDVRPQKLLFSISLQHTDIPSIRELVTHL